MSDVIGNDYFTSKKHKKWLKDILTWGEARITFTKKDGTERVMNCTLDENQFPEYEKKTDRTRKVNDDVLSVVDTDLNEWRSFRWDSIKNVEWSLTDNPQENK